MKSLKVIFLSSWFPSNKSPFDGNFVIRHAEAVSKYHSVTMLNVSKDPLIDKSKLITSPDVQYVEIKYSGCRFSTINRIKVIFLITRYFKRLSKDQFPDIIHVNVIYPIGLIALYLKFRYHIPYIITEHWSDYISGRNHLLSRSHCLFTKLICKYSSFICPVSNRLSDSMNQLNFNGNYQVIANAVNTDLFVGNHTVMQRKRIIHISNQNPEKNIEGILDVIKRLIDKYNFEFVLISDNPFDETIKYMNQICLPVEKVIFLGPLAPSQIAGNLLQADLFLMFSHYENLPCVIAEAHVAGVPVFATNVGGISEMIDDSNGKLVDEGDQESMVDLITDFMEDRIHFNCQKIREGAFKRYSYDAVGAKYSDLYYKSLKSYH